MLLHAILLLGSLAAAEVAPPCDTSLIEGVTIKEVSFDFYNSASASAQLRVRCASNSSLKAIKLHSGPEALHSNQFDSLTCDENKGWTAHVYSPSEELHYKVANASSPVTISCSVEYCAVESTGGELIARRTSDDFGTLSVECPAGQELIEPTYKPSARYYTRNNLFPGGKLTCSQHDGWTRNDSTSFAANASEPMRRVECRDYSHCDPSQNPSLMEGIRANKIQFSINDNGQRVWSCVHRDTALAGMFSEDHSVVEQERRVESLRCDHDGWAEYALGGDATPPRKLGSSSYNTYTCFEYCAIVSDTGLIVEHLMHGDDFHPYIQNLHIKCTGKSRKLFYNGNYVDYASCGMLNGWKLWESSDISDKTPFKPQHLECRSDSNGKRSSRATRTAEGKQEE